MTDRRKRVGIREVAAAAGVSRTTASDALNAVGRIDPGTRDRVVAAARELGYRANPHARRLRGARSGMIAIASSVPGALRGKVAGLEYAMRVLMGAASRAMASDSTVMLLPLEPDPDVAGLAQADGALLLDPVAASPLLARLDELGIPSVSTGRIPDRPADAGHWVDNDLHAATRSMLDLLWERGARRPALLTGPPLHSYSVDTLRAYESWTAERGLPSRVAMTEAVTSEGAGFEAAASLLDAPEPPDGIYATLDRLAAGALLAARARGIDVPAQLMLAAGSDSDATRAATPAVTAVELHPQRIGELAVDLLLELVREPSLPSRQVIVEAEIVERGSTRR